MENPDPLRMTDSEVRSAFNRIAFASWTVAEEDQAEKTQLQAAYQPVFRYYSVEYRYPDGSVVTSGAYADRRIAEMNARLNTELTANVVEVWY